MDFIKNTLTKINVQDDTLYDIIYNLLLFAGIKESEDDIKNGRFCTLEELKDEMEAMYESYNNSNG